MIDPSFTPGIYHFGIWLWQKIGIRDEVVLQPICNNQAITDRFLEVLEHGLPILPGEIQIPDQAVFDQLDVNHQRLWSKAQAQHKADNRQLAQYRKESLQTSHQAHISQLRTQLTQATEENIKRMRLAQINNAEADFHRRMDALNKAAQRADIITQPVAFAIEHLVVPIAIPGSLDRRHQFKTQFLFPFIPGQERSLLSGLMRRGGYEQKNTATIWPSTFLRSSQLD